MHRSDQLLLRAFVISDERADVICSSARPVGLPLEAGLWGGAKHWLDGWIRWG
jgi:hypothetical protein